MRPLPEATAEPQHQTWIKTSSPYSLSFPIPAFMWRRAAAFSTYMTISHSETSWQYNTQWYICDNSNRSAITLAETSLSTLFSPDGFASVQPTYRLHLGWCTNHPAITQSILLVTMHRMSTCQATKIPAMEHVHSAVWFDSEPERAPIRTKLLSTAPFTHSHRHPPYSTFKALCITSDPKSTLRRESDEYKQAAHLFPPFLLLKISILILRNQFFFFFATAHRCHASCAVSSLPVPLQCNVAM